MENNDAGLLLNKQNIILQRSYFKEMTRLLGINVLYRAPIEGSKQYNLYTELDAHYEQPIVVGCIFDEHVNQKTMRKLGWNAELNENTIVIHVPYDLKNIQAGAIFIIPAGLDNAEPRVFRVIRMSNITVYPASIACELGPIFFSESAPETVIDFKQSNFNLLAGEEEDYGH